MLLVMIINICQDNKMQITINKINSPHNLMIDCWECQDSIFIVALLLFQLDYSLAQLQTRLKLSNPNFGLQGLLLNSIFFFSSSSNLIIIIGPL